MKIANKGVFGVILFSFGTKKTDRYKATAAMGLDDKRVMILNATFLPNPYGNPRLRPLTGLDQPVIDWLVTTPNFHRMFQESLDRITLERPDGVGVFCVGGRHRSVVLVEALEKALATKARPVTLKRHLQLGA